MSADIWFPAAICLLAAGVWFMSMVAGAFLNDTRRADSVAGKAWYGCSLIAVEWLVIFAWIMGRYIPGH